MIGLSILATLLLVAVVVLWRDNQGLRSQLLAQSQKAADRILTVKGVRPLNEPLLEKPSTPKSSVIQTADELDQIRDQIDERMEMSGFSTSQITREQAAAEVWASLGYDRPPVIL